MAARCCASTISSLAGGTTLPTCNFVVQAPSGAELTVDGDGSQTRSFCCVDDLLDGIVRLMRTERGFIGPVNIGNPQAFTMLALAQLTLKLTGSSSKVVFRPLPTDDPTQRCPDISLAQAKLNWQPQVPLERGLQRVIDYFAGAH